MDNEIIGGMAATDAPATSGNLDTTQQLDPMAQAEAMLRRIETNVVDTTAEAPAGAVVVNDPFALQPIPAQEAVTKSAEPVITAGIPDTPTDPAPDVIEQGFDWKALYHAERLAHLATQAKLKGSEAFEKSARAMGFSGAGIHTGA
jgi:hypothetical protein